MLINSKNYFYAFVMLCFLSLLSPLHAATPLTDLIPIHEAFVPKFTDPTPLTFIAKQPPAPIQEVIPSKPYADAIWISGYWAFLESQNDFVWICGVWRRPPPNQLWIPGSWNQTNQGWIWGRGFWSPVPLAQLQYIKEAPPAAITDQIPKAPGNDYFFAPGYWNYSPNSKSYTWLSGKWELSNPDWILAPASYIFRPEGYIFVPFYWDFPLEARGTAYSCKDGPLVIVEPRFILQNLFFCYPDYVIFYWHWWHFHPDWAWDGCGCIPPWWHWHGWWFYGWSDSWGLWWWWGHPGAFPPFWLSLELSLEIAPPPMAILNFFKNLPKPLFDLQLGDKALLPKGVPGKKDLPLPIIPNDKLGNGQINLPSLPNIQITLPTPPPKEENPPIQVEPEVEYYTPQQDNEPDYYYPPERQKPYYPNPDRWRWNDRDHHDRHDHGKDRDRYDDRGKGKDRDDNNSQDRGHGRGRGKEQDDNRGNYKDPRPEKIDYPSKSYSGHSRSSSSPSFKSYNTNQSNPQSLKNSNRNPNSENKGDN